MNIEKVRDLYNIYQRQADHGPRVRREVLPDVVRYVLEDEDFGVVAYSALTSETVDRVIDEQIIYFQGLNMAFEWKYYDYDTPATLKDRLEAHGLVLDDEEAIMVLEIESAPEKLLQPVTHDIRKLTRETLSDADAINAVVWDDPDAVSSRVLPMWDADPSSVSVYCAYVDGVPVSYGRVEFTPDGNPFSSIWAGATLPEYRNRGLYSALVAIRLQEAIARGKHYLTIDANPETSMPIVAKLGFVEIARSVPCMWYPSKA